MIFEELTRQYALNDGEVKTFYLDISTRTAQVHLAVRKQTRKDKWISCDLRLEFAAVSEVSFFEDFPTSGGYSDITIKKLDDQTIYLSLDPHGNSGLPHPEDNWTIRAGSLTWTEL